MDIAADAVFELTAPAPRAPGEKAARAEAPDEPSFEDHLAPETDDKPEPAAMCEPPAPPTPAPTQSPLAAPPLLLQMIESAEPKSAPLLAAPANSKPPAPTDLPAATPAPPPPSGPQSDAAPVIAAAPMQPAVISPTPQAPPQPSKGTQIKADPSKPAPVETIEPDAIAATPTAAINATAPTGENVAVPAPATSVPAAPLQSPRAPTPGAPEPTRGDVKANVTVGQAKPNAAPATAKSAAKVAAPVAATGEATTAPRADSFDATMLAQSAHASTTAAQAQQATIERGAERAAPALQVGREIVRRFQGESTRFELRLDPPELGRIEVRLDVSRDNRVTAIVSADNPQALTDLVRHARELEQSLQAAGLELSENGLSFDLRQQGDDRSRQAERETSNGGDGSAINSPTPEAVITARPLGFERWRGLRVDVMA
jgi:hypothetical protein